MGDRYLAWPFFDTFHRTFARDFWRNELTVTSSYGAAPVDLEAALSLIANKTINVKDTITQTLPLEQIQAAFKIVAEAKESLKVVLEP